MSRVLSTIGFSLLLIIISHTLSEGQLTPLTNSGAKNTQLTKEVEKKTVSPVLLASNQPIAEELFTVEDIEESNLSDENSDCDGTLFGTRWCDNKNGTVTDLSTGLVWLKTASWGDAYPYWSGSISETNAFGRASQVETGNPEFLSDNSVKGDWRLPTISELKALTSGTEAVSSSNMRAFIDVQPDWYWSATDYKTGSDSALNVGMHFGDVNHSSKRFNYHVWPVRNKNE